jgi:hypothetical protein
MSALRFDSVENRLAGSVCKEMTQLRPLLCLQWQLTVESPFVVDILAFKCCYERVSIMLPVTGSLIVENRWLLLCIALLPLPFKQTFIAYLNTNLSRKCPRNAMD